MECELSGRKSYTAPEADMLDLSPEAGIAVSYMGGSSTATIDESSLDVPSSDFWE